MWNYTYIEKLFDMINDVVNGLIFCHENAKHYDDNDYSEYTEAMDNLVRKILPIMCVIGCNAYELENFIENVDYHYEVNVDIYQKLENAYICELRHIRDMSSTSETSYWCSARLGHKIYNQLVKRGIDLDWLIEDSRFPWDNLKKLKESSK